MPTPLVLIHGGGVDHRTWDLVVDQLTAPVLAVDLPGRGRHPRERRYVGIDDAARTVLADIDEAGFDHVVLAAHSLGGCVVPRTAELLGDRLAHAVFIACTVPEQGRSAVNTLEPSFFDDLRAAREMDRDAGLATDLDDAQLAWFRERVVPESGGLATEKVDISPLHRPFPRTWVRTVRDVVVPPEKQLRFAGNVGNCPVIDLDAGHTCMVTHASELAALLDRIAADPAMISAGSSL